MPMLLLFVPLLTIAGFLFLYERRRKPLRFLQAPPLTSSWLLGHEHELSNQSEVGELEYQWFRCYGSVFRTAGCFGEDIMMVSDFQALHHILNTGFYQYPKSSDTRGFHKQIGGRGITWAEGSVHQRHKKVVSPAFSEPQLRTFIPLFQTSMEKLALRWKRQYGDGETVDVAEWLSKVTLNILGESAFGLQFDSIVYQSKELALSLQNVFGESRRPTKFTTLVNGLKRSLPESVVDLLERWESREDRSYRDSVDMTKVTARCLMELKQKRHDGSKGSCILNHLLQANAAEDPKKRLDEDEVLSQISTIIFAGYKNIASTLAWLLYELSMNPRDQETLRDEVDRIRSTKGDGAVLSSEDYDSMPFLNACIKEALRLHPAVHYTTRDAAIDDNLPLAQPVVSTSGETLRKIPITEGQRVYIAIGAYNRSQSVWGADADQWNPSRFVDSPKRQNALQGVFGNLMSFGTGVRACVGWRFAVIELQVILAGLLEAFEFSIPPGGLDIQTVPLRSMTSPMVRGKEGLQMPLVIKHRQRI